MDFSHGGENDLRRARIPLGTALHERPTPTFPFPSDVFTDMHTKRRARERTNDNEPKLARFLPKEWSGEAYEETDLEGDESDRQARARVAIVYLSSSCNSDARDISLGLLMLTLRCLRE